MGTHYPRRVDVLLSIRTALAGLLLASLLSPTLALADIAIEEPDPFEIPPADIEITLRIDGKDVNSGDSVELPIGEPVEVSFWLPEQHEGYIDTDYEPFDGSEESNFFFSAYYLDLYKGSLYSDAHRAFGRQVNEDAHLNATSTIVFPEPGEYSFVFYDSGLLRDPVLLCNEPYSCSPPEWEIGNIREAFEQGQTETSRIISSGFAIVHFSVTAAQAGASNVLFLPGIKGSRLYRAGDKCGFFDFFSCEEEEKLWEPGVGDGIIGFLKGAGESDVRDLFLNPDGSSKRDDVYVKVSDILDEAGGNRYYASFMEDMDDLKQDGTVADWRPVAYDWRLSLSDIIEKGKQEENRISYSTATSTPYIEQTLRELASSSKTGKVTIIAHSNGGLVAKALLQKLGDEETASLVDKVILVGVPQSGAPQSIGSLLFGYREGIPEFAPLLVPVATARAFAEYSPMAYHLLPSTAYFEAVQDEVHSVAKFSGNDSYAKEIAAYGSSIQSSNELSDFLLARDGGRVRPGFDDLYKANILSEELISYAASQHNSLDSWTPPDGVSVYQIAGWGADTVAGVEFYELPASVVPVSAEQRRLYRPIFVEDGDGVVPAPSGLLIDKSSSVSRHWVNLDLINRSSSGEYNHGNLLEIEAIREFLFETINNQVSINEYILDEQPEPINQSKKLVFYLHSPLTLGVKDESGNYTGSLEDGSVKEGIQDSQYGQFGEVKYVIVPANKSYDVEMIGTSDGTFSLDIQEISNNSVFATATIANVPVTDATIATLQISNGIGKASPLLVDRDGNGSIDVSIAVRDGETTTPQGIQSVDEQSQDSGISYGSVAAQYSIPEVSQEIIRIPISTLLPLLDNPASEFIDEEMLTTFQQQISTRTNIVAPTQTASVFDAVLNSSRITDLSHKIYFWIRDGIHTSLTFLGNLWNLLF